MKNLLVPIGSNENARNTLQYAIEFARELDSRIYLVHVYSSSKISGAFINVDNIIERDSREILKEHVESVDSEGVEIITSTLKGHSESDTIKQLVKLLEIDLPTAHTHVSCRDVCLGADVAIQLGHEALAEAHDLMLAPTSRIEVGAALGSPHGQSGEAVFEHLFEGEELQDPQVHRGVKA